jgi:hypothetical protein
VPAITKNIFLGYEETILTATQELIIISGTVTNISPSDVFVSVAVTRGLAKFFIIQEMLLPSKNYPPIIRRPENICTKLILGAGHKISAIARVANEIDYWKTSTNSLGIHDNWQSILYGPNDGLATINFGYFPMED